MRSPLLLLALLLPACQEYGFTPEPDPEEVDTDGLDTGVDTDISIPDPDPDCSVTPAPARDAALNDDCQLSGLEPVEDPWNVGIEWQYQVGTSGGWASGVIVMPAVGNLDDDDGDGIVTGDDDPEVVFTTWFSNTLVALHGDGSVMFELPGYDGQAGVTIADVDGDGEPEIIAAKTAMYGGYYSGFEKQFQIDAINAQGQVEWTPQPFPMQMYPQPAVGDIDGDGDVEVVFDRGVVDGTTGAAVATLAAPTSSWRTPVLADIDADGTQEIILAGNVYSHTGAIEWSSTGTGWGNFAAVADIDGDIGGEVFFLSGSEMAIHDDDGTLIRTVPIPGTNPGPPSVADFDGDGEVEIVSPANYAISMFEVDGTLVWSQPMQDGSGLAGCSGYDVNGDGAYEVLFADEADLRIYDGKTGAVLYVNGTHSSGTVWEYPVIADVDNDGSAEVLIASNGGEWQGITVFGHNGDGWSKSGPTWGTHDFAVTNLLPDGSVPTPPPLPWLDENVFRARPATDELALPDLTVDVTDVCLTGCGADGLAKIAWQVSNGGAATARAGFRVGLRDTSGVTRAQATVGVDVESGRSPAGGVFEVAARDIAQGFSLAVDTTDIVSECSETNNETPTSDPVCP